MLRTIRIAPLIFMSVTLLWGGYTVDFSLPDFTFSVEQGFDRIRAKGFAFTGEPGAPELPSLYLKYIISPTAKAESLTIINSNIVDITGQFLVYPTQLPIIAGHIPPWVLPDPDIYNSDDLYPEKFIEIVNEGIMDGARIVTIAVHPLRYNPQLKRLSIVTNVEFEFAFGTTSLPELRPMKRGMCEQGVYDAMMRNTVVNDNEIPLYYQKPALVEEQEFITPRIPAMGPAMIITAPAFFEAFQPYADWLTDQGIPAFLISPQTIYGYASGVDEAEKIRNFISECHYQHGGTYFILGGMDSRFEQPPPFPEVPARRVFCYDVGYPVNPPHYDTIPCDHYYCALDGDWNADEDDTWGEMNDDVDQDPEVYVGRILCRSAQEVSNWVYKALMYEKSPANINSLDTAVWIFSTGWHMGKAIEEFPDHFTHIVDTNTTAYIAYSRFNHGYGYTNAQTEGALISFPTDSIEKYNIYSYWPTPPSRKNAGLNWLTNDSSYYIHYSVSCQTGFFDDPNLLCIAEAFVDSHQNYETGIPVGACASIEHTRYSIGSSDTIIPRWSFALQKYYYELLFSTDYTEVNPLEPSTERIGVALPAARNLMNWENVLDRFVSYSTNLFGSPTTDAWTKAPGNFSVWHPRTIPCGSAMEFQVIVTDASTSSPISDAKVCLNKPGDVYAVSYTDANGQITWIIYPSTVGTMKVTVTRLHNRESSYTQYLPSQTTCQVLYPPDGGQALESENTTPDHLCITHMPTLCRNILAIKFGVPHENAVEFTIYDITGSRIITKQSDALIPGYYEEHIDLRHLSNGVYFMRVQQGIERVTKKFLIVR